MCLVCYDQAILRISDQLLLPQKAVWFFLSKLNHDVKTHFNFDGYGGVADKSENDLLLFEIFYF